MKIVLAVDGSAFSDAAVAEVSRRPWPEGSEVKVLSAMELPAVPAVDPWMVSPDFFEEAQQAARQSAIKAVESAVSTLGKSEDRTLKVTSEVVEGAAKQVILDGAEKWGADLIVVGAQGKGFLDRFLLGSVSQAVATHATCSVEIVRQKKEL